MIAAIILASKEVIVMNDLVFVLLSALAFVVPAVLVARADGRPARVGGGR